MSWRDAAPAAGSAAAQPASVTSQPVVIVDADHLTQLEIDLLRLSPSVLIGVAGGEPDARVTRQLDLTFGEVAAVECLESTDPARDADRLAEVVTDRPLASMLLTRLLRNAEGCSPEAGIAMEAGVFSALLAGREFAGWLAGRPVTHDDQTTVDPVRVARAGDTLTIELARPHRRNAFSAGMRDALVDALQLAALEGLRVLLRGAGPVFSSGGDLAEFGTTPDPATAWLIRMSRNPGLLIQERRDRVTAHIHGRCAGAGIEIPLFAGSVVAAPDTTLRLPEVAMGLIPGAGGTVSLARRAGRWRTLWLALSGVELSAATALEWGLVDAIR